MFAVLLVSTAIMGSGHIALAYIFSNSGNNQETQQDCGNSCTVTSSNTISTGTSALTTPTPSPTPTSLTLRASAGEVSGTLETAAKKIDIT